MGLTKYWAKSHQSLIVDVKDRKKRERTVHVAAMKIWRPSLLHVITLAVRCPEMEEGALQIPDYHIGNPEMFDTDGAVHFSRRNLKIA